MSHLKKSTKKTHFLFQKKRRSSSSCDLQTTSLILLYLASLRTHHLNDSLSKFTLKPCSSTHLQTKTHSLNSLKLYHFFVTFSFLVCSSSHTASNVRRCTKMCIFSCVCFFTVHYHHRQTTVQQREHQSRARCNRQKCFVNRTISLNLCT